MMNCKQRIKSEYENTVNTLRDLFEFACENDYDEYHPKHETNLYEYGLCFDYVEPGTFDGQEKGYARYQLSWGGPSDEFRFYVDYDDIPYHIEYWFLDWFDGAHVEVRGDDKELLENIYDFMTCGDPKSWIDNQVNS